MDNEEKRDHNHEIFDSFFKRQDEWIEDYIRTDDYRRDYVFLLGEGDTAKHRLEKILRNKYLPTKMASTMLEWILFNNMFSDDTVDEYSSESNNCLDSFPIDEYENQIEIKSIKEETENDLLPIDNQSFLDCLEEYLSSQRNFCLHHSNIFREYATIEQYILTGLRIDFYLTEEQLEESIVYGIECYCRMTDRNRKDKIDPYRKTS